MFLKSEEPQVPSFWSLKKTQKFSVTYGNDVATVLLSLSQAVENARSLLASAGFGSKALERQELIDLIYKYLNPKRSREIDAPAIVEKIGQVEAESPRNSIIFGDLILDHEEFVLDRVLTRVLTLKNLPEVTFAGMMSVFNSLQFKYEMMFSFHIPDQSKEVKGLEQKRRMAHSLTSNSRVAKQLYDKYCESAQSSRQVLVQNSVERRKIMKLLLISVPLLFLTACQTLPGSKISVDREPAAAVMKEEWKTLNWSDPESYLGKAQIQVKENQRKDILLFQCQASSLLKEGQTLNRDLLFIRLESWTTERLHQEYVKSLGEASLKCLIGSIAGV